MVAKKDSYSNIQYINLQKQSQVHSPRVLFDRLTRHRDDAAAEDQLLSSTSQQGIHELQPDNVTADVLNIIEPSQKYGDGDDLILLNNQFGFGKLEALPFQ